MQNRKLHYSYSDKFLIHQIDLIRTDLAEEDERNSGLVCWAELFRAETWEQIKALSAQNSFIRKAAIEMYELTAEDKVRIMLEEKRRNEMDYYSFIRRAEEQAQKKGLEQGRAEGREEGRQEGLKQGTQIGAEKAVSLMTFLSQEELKELSSVSGEERKEVLTRLLKKYHVE